MRAQRGLMLLLFLVAAFCSTGVSLKCYNCLDPVTPCKLNTTCSPNLDACLIAVSGRMVHQQCWLLADCNAKFIMSRLELAKVQYRCCQKDMCNKNLEEEKPKNEATSLLGKASLLVTSVLASILKLCF